MLLVAAMEGIYLSRLWTGRGCSQLSPDGRHWTQIQSCRSSSKHERRDHTTRRYD